MLTAVFDTTLEKFWGERDNPFFALAMGDKRSPETGNVVRRIRFAADRVSTDFDMLGYDFFDLLRERGHFPGALPRPANDNLRAAA